MSRVYWLLAVVLLTSAVAPSVGTAQGTKMILGKKGPAYIEPPTDEPCYPLMGEFVGEISVGENEKQLLGLQIRPVGGDLEYADEVTLEWVNPAGQVATWVRYTTGDPCTPPANLNEGARQVVHPMQAQEAQYGIEGPLGKG